MNNVTRIAFQFSIALVSASLAAAPLPKEGPVNTVNCFVGDMTSMESSKDNQFISGVLYGMRFATTEGGFGDAQTAQCLTQAHTDATGRNATGVCIYADADGDKVTVDVAGKNGAGKWTYTSGTGKYAGITGSGEYKSLRKFPAMMQPGKFGVCNSATGTYKLP